MSFGPAEGREDWTMVRADHYAVRMRVRLFCRAWPLSMVRPSYELSVVAVFLAATAVEFAAAPANAQPASATNGSTASVVSYDAQGRPVIRAIHVPEGLQVDGILDEALYRDVIPVSEFYQMEPNPGEPSTEKTEVWVAYDGDHVYVSVRCWDSQPEERWVVNEMRRDDLNVVRNENVAIMFDTFFDRRNGALLEMNPLGGIWDGLVENEQAVGADWNPVWDRSAGRFDGGWRRCCTNRDWPARYPPTGSSPADAI